MRSCLANLFSALNTVIQLMDDVEDVDMCGRGHDSKFHCTKDHGVRVDYLLSPPPQIDAAVTMARGMLAFLTCSSHVIRNGTSSHCVQD